MVQAVSLQFKGIEINDVPERKERYAFWETQPVRQFNEADAEVPDAPDSP